ncbi:MAG: L,D-transpeptidase family protein [Alphaproteobacteria bacterium]|nr:L,D-transpeptidase family protein [Alphaproteobacteria bacterium]
MDLIVKSSNLAIWGDTEIRCAVGRKGFCSFEDRVDGNETTPVGRWNMREVFYRPDKIERADIATDLPVRALDKNDGWCDEPGDPNYNRFVKRPYPASAEKLWRDDDLYDIIVVLGYNDAPVVKGKGSAIFLHVARENFGGTAGCISVSRRDLLKILRGARIGSAVLVSPQA